MIEVLQVPSELTVVATMYREKQPTSVLEIGTWQGGTLKVWMENAAPAASIVAVDLDHSHEHLYADWLREDTYLHVVVGDSHDPAVIKAVTELGPYDWVFIDGDHGKDEVRSDIGNYLPLITEGGLLLLHDVTPPTGEDTYPPGDALRDLRHSGYDCLIISDPADSDVAHGIGVVQL